MTSWRALARDPQFRRGARDMLVFLPGLAAWGLVTGVAMVKGGLGVPLAVMMSLLVYAGTAQLAALPLIVAGAPMPVVLAAAFCVNLRFVIYSAQWRPYLEQLPRSRRVALAYFAADINYVVFSTAWRTPTPQPGQVPYLLGTAIPLWLAWQTASLAGIALADVIPTPWGLGFAGTLAMLGLSYSLLVDRAAWTAALVSGTAAVAAFALPLKLNILVAIAAAVAAGLLVEQGSRAGGRRWGHGA